MVLLDRIRQNSKEGIRRSLMLMLLGLIFIIGVLDQTSESIAPPYDWIKSEYSSDQEFIGRIEAIMPENAMIFQLPYVPFPENPPVYGMVDYDHFRGYLHSKNLRWSYGAMKGRDESKWQKMVAELPVDEMVRTLSQKGFKGIYLDSNGYNDRGASITSNITRATKIEPLVSANGRLYFFAIST